MCRCREQQSQRELRLKTSARILIIALTAGLAVASLRAGQLEWPQFRGPSGSGIAAADARPATTWSDSQNVQWKVALPGPGSSSPIVVGERVFITCYSGYGDGSSEGSLEKLRRHLLCLERQTGKVLWDKSVPAELPKDSYSGNLREQGYASNTPVTDGERGEREGTGKREREAAGRAGRRFLWRTMRKPCENHANHTVYARCNLPVPARHTRWQLAGSWPHVPWLDGERPGSPRS